MCLACCRMKGLAMCCAAVPDDMASLKSAEPGVAILLTSCSKAKVEALCPQGCCGVGGSFTGVGLG